MSIPRVFKYIKLAKHQVSVFVFFSSGVNLKNSDLEGSQLGNVNLRVATLKGANLQNCILRGAVLAGADLEVRYIIILLLKWRGDLE